MRYFKYVLIFTFLTTLTACSGMRFGGPSGSELAKDLPLKPKVEECYKKEARYCDGNYSKLDVELINQNVYGLSKTSHYKGSNVQYFCYNGAVRTHCYYFEKSVSGSGWTVEGYGHSRAYIQSLNTGY